MATLKQLRDIFEPILARYPDLALRGRWLFRPPVEIAIVGLYIGRTSSASDSDMDMSVIPLSRFRDPSSFGFNDAFEVERVIGMPPRGRWVRGVDEGPPRIFQDMFAPEYRAHLIRNFDAKVLPFLDSVHGTPGVVAWLQSKRGSTYRSDSVELIDGWVAAMQGDFATAARHLQAYIDWMGSLQLSRGAEEQRHIGAIRDVLLTENKAQVAAYLHQMEERTITHHRLQRFWRRSPFPFEAASL
jgi:hypothetical protein